MTPRQTAALHYAEKEHPSSAGIIRRAYLGTAPASGAIRAKCLDCSHFDRDEVDNCAANSCPLWLYRPRFGANKKLKMSRRRAKAQPVAGDVAISASPGSEGAAAGEGSGDGPGTETSAFTLPPGPSVRRVVDNVIQPAGAPKQWSEPK